MEKIETHLLEYQFDLAPVSRYDPQQHIISQMRATKSPVINLFCRGLVGSPFSSVLLRIHGYYPYIMVQVPPCLDVEQLRLHLAHQIELAFVNYSADIVSKISCVVHNIEVVSGIPFVGVHKATLFFKVYLTEWNLSKILTKYLKTGKCGMKYEVYEAHISDITKLLIDGGIENGMISTSAEKSAFARSSCDYEFDSCWAWLYRGKNEYGKFGHSQITPEERWGFWSANYLRRKDLLQQQNEQINYEEIDRISEYSDSESAASDFYTNENLNINAFDGGGEEDEENDNEIEQETIRLSNYSQLSKDANISTLKYSNLLDIPPKAFTWSGKKYYFNRENGELQESYNDDVSDNATAEKQRAFTFKPDSDEHTRGALGDASAVGTQMQKMFDSAQEQCEELDFQNAETDYLEVMHIEYSEILDCIYYFFYSSEDEFVFQNGREDITEIGKFGLLLFDENVRFDEARLRALLSCHFPSLRPENVFDIRTMDKKSALISYLPLMIQSIDPDFIFSWQNEYNGIAKIAIEASQFENFDFLQAISKTPKKANQYFEKLCAKTDIYEYLKSNSVWQNAYSAQKQIPGRLLLSVWNISRRVVKSNDSSIFYFDRVINESRCTRCDISTSVQYFHDEKNEYLYDDERVAISGQADVSLSYQEIFKYDISKLVIGCRIIESTGFIVEIQESASLYDIPLFEVLSRGTEFKNEQKIFVKGREQGYIIGPTPSNEEIAQMRASECLPLVMEPQSAYYSYPMLVFDFVSLYPSIMAAYNICYSTILKDFEKKDYEQADDKEITPQEAFRNQGQETIGPYDVQFYTGDLEGISENDYNVLPVGSAFLKWNKRKGIISSILQEDLVKRKEITKQLTKYQCLLDILKGSVHNEEKSNIASTQRKIEELKKEVSRLKSRSTEIKGTMNGVSGCAAGAFSGRMPIIEVGDSILQQAREVLEQSIKYIETNFPGLHVVYADTDSIFVDTSTVMKKHTQMAAASMLILSLKIGKEILKEINDKLVEPVKLRFENIYFPAILLSKKRYVGKAYTPEVLSTMLDNYVESNNSEFSELVRGTQSEFEYDVSQTSLVSIQLSNIPSVIDAKGIESIKRDVPFVVEETMSQALEVLFATSDLSQVKEYLLQEFTSIIMRQQYRDFIMRNRVIDKEYVQQSLAQRITGNDKEEYYLKQENGEYVFYIISNTVSTKMESVRSVEEMAYVFKDGSELDINYVYYFERLLVPALERMFGLCGFNIEVLYLNFCNELQKLPNFEWFTVDYQRESKFSYFTYSPNCDIVPYVRYTKLFLKLYECNTITEDNEFTQKLKENQEQIMDIRIKRPQKRCVCCNQSSIFPSKQLSICQFCFKHHEALIRIKSSLLNRFNVVQRCCRECGGISCDNQLVCCNWRCDLFWEYKETYSFLVQICNVIFSIENVELK